jgi:hypothetical protein
MLAITIYIRIRRVSGEIQLPPGKVNYEKLRFVLNTASNLHRITTCAKHNKLCAVRFFIAWQNQKYLKIF